MQHVWINVRCRGCIEAHGGFSSWVGSFFFDLVAANAPFLSGDLVSTLRFR